MKNVDIREFISGVVLITIGLFVALYALSHYEIGVPARMGPGFFPAALGWILAGLGSIVVMLSFRQMMHALSPPPFALRPFLAVVIAVAAFSILIDRLGLIPTTLISVVIASFANRVFRLRRAVFLGILLGILSWLIFTLGLQMTLPAFVLSR